MSFIHCIFIGLVCCFIKSSQSVVIKVVQICLVLIVAAIISGRGGVLPSVGVMIVTYMLGWKLGAWADGLIANQVGKYYVRQHHNKMEE